MKIILINPKYPFYRGKDLFPLGLGYIAAISEKYAETKVIDMNVEKTNIEQAVKEFMPDIVGITSTSPAFPEAKRIASEIRNVSPAKIIIGGVHATFRPDEALEASDIAVRGEGELTFEEILSGKPVEEIKGVSFKKDGMIIHNPDRELTEAVDTFPSPAYHLFPIKKYTIMSAISSRGCPFNCVYCCSTRFWRNKIRYRHVDSFYKEIEWLSKNGVRTLKIHDSTFTIDKSRVMNFCNKMIESDLDLFWSCETRPDTLDDDMLAKLKEAKCILICIGVDSASELVLKNANRQMKKECIEKIFHKAREIGIRTRAYITFGLPGENEESVKETIEFLKRVKPDQTMLSLATKYPGTNLASKRINFHPHWLGKFEGHDARFLELYIPDGMDKKKYQHLADFMHEEIKKIQK